MSYFRFPHYEIYCGIKRAKSARVANRRNDKSLRDFLVDVHLLAHTDHLLCTFSSQVCRLAYELMQTIPSKGDKGKSFQSLDDIYYYGAGQRKTFTYLKL